MPISKQEEAITFYRILLKGCKDVLEHLDPTALQHRLGNAYFAMYGKQPTREHIALAIARHNKNQVKRAWDEKQQYIIVLFLKDPTLSNRQVQESVQAMFKQRTRITVFDSCREAARMIVKRWKSEKVKDFITVVEADVIAKSREPNVLEV